MTAAQKRRVVVLGATGSIGTQTLDIIRNNREQFVVVGLSAFGKNVALLAALAIEFEVECVALAQGTAAQDLQLALYAQAQAQGFSEGHHKTPKILIGADAATQLARVECDVVVNGITGAVGLNPTVAALECGRSLALANKESLVIGGIAVTKLAAPNQIIPVDSEHSAIAQALVAGTAREVKRLVLTASGGPFRGKSKAELTQVTPQQALAHPTWAMGPVVTINSATMMNKGLEIIEASLLFNIPIERIDVVVHPQSVVHSMVEFIDGSTIAQASPPDMHLPISLALNWPSRVDGAASGCDWTKPTSWTFEPVDEVTFPAITLAKRVGTLAGSAPAVMNAANEVAVAEFLSEMIEFLDIIELVSRVVDEHLASNFIGDDDLTINEVLLAADWATNRAHELIADGSFKK